MLLGITTFGKRISPRFDCALGLLLVETEGNEILGRKEESMKGVPGGGRVSFLVERGVQTVLTGGIRRSDYFAALDAGLMVHAGFMGEAEEILRRYLTGTLPRFGPGMDLSPIKRNRKRTRIHTHRKEGSNHPRGEGKGPADNTRHGQCRRGVLIRGKRECFRVRGKGKGCGYQGHFGAGDRREPEPNTERR